MKPLLTTAILIALCAPAYAGGPVLTTEETTEVSPAHDRKVPVWVFVVLGVAVAAAIAGGGSDPCTTVDPVTPTGPCQ